MSHAEHEWVDPDSPDPILPPVPDAEWRRALESFRRWWWQPPDDINARLSFRLGDVALAETWIRDAIWAAGFGSTDYVWVIDFIWHDIPTHVYSQGPGYAAVSAAWLDHPEEFGQWLRTFLAVAPAATGGE